MITIKKALVRGLQNDPADVKIVQTLLNDKGARLTVDGKYGENSENAVLDFQEANGLVRDGKVWTQTLNALLGIVDGFPKKPPFHSMSSTERERVFGKFSYHRKDSGDGIEIEDGWEVRNVIQFYIPQLKDVPYYTPTNTLKCNGIVYLHKHAGPIFQKFFRLVDEAGLSHLIKTYDGAYNPRFVRGSTRTLSNHSWGTAIDINAYANGLGAKPAALGKDGCLLPLVDLATSCGIYWGGFFTRPDGMHFEIGVAGID